MWYWLLLVCVAAIIIGGTNSFQIIGAIVVIGIGVIGFIMLIAALIVALIE